MDSAGAARREVEKPKTPTERRRALIALARDRMTKLEAQSKAVAECFAPRTPVVDWLEEARKVLEACVVELERIYTPGGRR